MKLDRKVNISDFMDGMKKTNAKKVLFAWFAKFLENKNFDFFLYFNLKLFWFIFLNVLMSNVPDFFRL